MASNAIFQRDGGRRRSGDERALDLPSLFRPVKLREAGDAFAYACAHAAEFGPGALVHVGRFDIAEFAVVLEAEEPLVAARRAFYAGMAALGDALAALAPPEKPIAVDWPDAILVDNGLIGGGRLAWPEAAAEDAEPDWLVFGAMIRVAWAKERDPGLHPSATALAEEGFEEASFERLVAGFARHLMVMADDWRESGFAEIARNYLTRLKPERGRSCRIAENGDLVLRDAAGTVTLRRLVPALRRASWLDAGRGEPRR